MQDVPSQNRDSSYKALFLRYAKQVPSLKHIVWEKKKNQNHRWTCKKERVTYDVDTNPFRIFFYM